VQSFSFSIYSDYVLCVKEVRKQVIFDGGVIQSF
jgi:hypothetical protein